MNHHLSLVRPACLVEARAAKKIRTSLAMQRHEQVRKLHCQWRMWRKSVMMWDDVKGSGIGQVQTGDVDCFKPRRCLWSLHNYDRHTCNCRFAESPSVIYPTIWVWGWFTWSFIPFPDHGIASPKHEPRSWQPRPLGHRRELKVSWDDSTWTLEVAFHLSLFFSQHNVNVNMLFF